MKPIARIFALAALSIVAAIGQQYAFLPVAGSPTSVKNLFQDSQGRLWIGGDQVSVFDGTRFFFLRDYGLPPAQTFAFAEDPSGAIWIATENGVYRFAGGRTQLIAPGMAVSVIAATPDLAVAAIGPAGKGAMSDASLVRMTRSGATWKTETVAPIGSLDQLTLDPAGRLLYAWPLHGWLEIRLDDVAKWRAGTELSIDRHISPAPGWPMKVLRDRAGCFWVGTTGGNGYDCGDGTHLAIPGNRPESNLHEAADGAMVLWGGNVLAVGRPGAFQVATSANGLPGLTDAIRAADGTVWLGTTHGLYRTAGLFQMEHWTTRDGLPDPPWSVTRSGGHIFAGMNSRIVVLNQDKTRWETFATLSAGVVAGLAGAPDGGLFAAVNGGAVQQVDPHGRVIARSAHGQSAVGMRVTRTPDGQVWSGGTGLRRISRSGELLTAEEQPLRKQPPQNLLSIKYEANTRKLWSCYAGGAVMRDEKGAWREIGARDGLLIDPCWSLAPLPNGDVWYAYFNLPALALLRPNQSGGYTVRQYQAKDGVIEPGGDSLDLDRAGRLWRGGDLGVYTADPAEAEAGNWLKLDLSDGLPANAINSGSAFADDDGSMWWGADNDVLHYLPREDLVAPRFAPRIFVSAFTSDGRTSRLADVIERLPHGSNITAHIGSLQFDRRNAMRLRYRLLPGQTAWRETSSFDLALGKLSAGQHTLEVQGRVFTGPWSPSVIRPFTVPLPVWLDWPMVSAYFLTAVLLPGLLYRWHRRRQAEESELLPDLAGWRLGALLPDVHDVAGTVLDARFEVGALLARGGFANVFAGFDRRRQQPCAVKIFRSEMKESAAVLRTFEQEVAALQRVCHANVVSIYARGIAPSETPYLVMEFVEGRNLREVLDAGPIAPERCARFLRELAGALDCIHAHGICHRDVKPENVMIRDAGAPRESAVLIDFSIAIVKDANESLHGLSRAAGSFDYMAPEQAIGYAEPSSDIYSLAKVAIEMLTGRQLKELLPDAAMDLPQRVRELLLRRGTGLSEESATMLATALEFDPSRRPREAGPFAAPIVRDLESQVRLRGR